MPAALDISIDCLAILPESAAAETSEDVSHFPVEEVYMIQELIFLYQKQATLVLITNYEAQRLKLSCQKFSSYQILLNHHSQ